MSRTPLRVLFLCTGNSARSQIAEALLRHLSKGRAEVFSAGSHAEREVHPMARAILEDQYGIATSGLRPKSVVEFANHHFDYVIAVCDRIAETCPVFPDDPEQIHWSFEDPAAIEDVEARQRAFERVAAEIAGRLRIWMALPSIRVRIESDDIPRAIPASGPFG